MSHRGIFNKTHLLSFFLSAVAKAPRGKSILLSADLFSLLCSNAINLSRCSHGHFDITPLVCVASRSCNTKHRYLSRSSLRFLAPSLLLFSFLSPAMLTTFADHFVPVQAQLGGRRQGALGGGDLRLKVGANPVSPAATATNSPYPAVFGSYLVT